jgi:hypothetical protein
VIESHSTSLNGRGGGGPARKRARERRFALIVGGVLILVLGASIFALSSDFVRSRHLPGLPGAGTISATDPEARSGSIVVTTSGGCRQSTFDNDTGRVTVAGKPCEIGELSNERGGSKPTGLSRRLDAISKSFSK